jgi:uncharacterized RDD family membrane protein YckC
MQTVMACSQCGRTFAQSDLVQIAGNWVCGNCKPAFLSRVMASGAPSPSAWHYGGFWIRVAARMIDTVVLYMAQIPIQLLFIGRVLFPGSQPPAQSAAALLSATLWVTVASWVLRGAYEVLMLRYFSATVGKMAVGLKVVRTDGSGLGWGIAVGRFFMYIVSGIILLIGYIMAGFDEEKRALHDRVCDTRVIYKRSLA